MFLVRLTDAPAQFPGVQYAMIRMLSMKVPVRNACHLPFEDLAGRLVSSIHGIYTPHTAELELFSRHFPHVRWCSRSTLQWRSAFDTCHISPPGNSTMNAVGLGSLWGIPSDVEIEALI